MKCKHAAWNKWELCLGFLSLLWYSLGNIHKIPSYIWDVPDFWHHLWRNMTVRVTVTKGGSWPFLCTGCLFMPAPVNTLPHKNMPWRVVYCIRGLTEVSKPPSVKLIGAINCMWRLYQRGRERESQRGIEIVISFSVISMFIWCKL